MTIYTDFREKCKTYYAEGIEIPRQMEEKDIFERQTRVPGHIQKALDNRGLLGGAGGLNSWIAVGLVRSGVTELIVCDHDIVSWTNLTRQLYFPEDLGKPKAHCLARNLVRHSTAQARITGVALSFEEAIEIYALPCDFLVVGVDNNPTRLKAVQFARSRKVPAIHIALSKDGMRLNALLQGVGKEDPCWHCAQPNLDAQSHAPCAASVISTCFVAAGIANFFVHRALMGWPKGTEPFNWREVDLLGVAPDRKGNVIRRSDCPTCGNL